MQAPTTRLGIAAVLSVFVSSSFSLFAAAPAHAAKNPIGYCTMDVEKAKKAGFDFIEVAVRNFTNMSDEDFAKFQAKTKELGMPTPVANNFLPGELKVVGPAVDEAKIMEYVNKALDRAKLLGIKTIVFGSGGARKVPDGFDKEEAKKQLVAIAKKMAPEAKKRGIVIAVEPLQSRETNIINTAAEGLEWVKAVGHPNFALMVDFYHLSNEKEDPAILVKAGKQLKHIHIANPKGRVFPLTAEEYDYSGFFAQLKKAGYKGGISVEGKALDYDKDATTTIAFLRGAAAKGVTAPVNPPVAEAGSAKPGAAPAPAPGSTAPAAPATPPAAPAPAK